jgi:hypothetical protein
MSDLLNPETPLLRWQPLRHTLQDKAEHWAAMTIEAMATGAWGEVAAYAALNLQAVTALDACDRYPETREDMRG